MRAIACLAVFGVHLQQATGITGTFGIFDVRRLMLNGNTGVAFFFMLSGFLLSLPIWSGDRKRVHPLEFAGRRVVRIIPAYYLCLTALVILGGSFKSPSGLLSAVLHYGFLHNLTDRTFYSISSPFWTIAVQAQFYLFFALALPLFVFVRRVSAWGLGFVFAGIAVGSYAAHLGVLALAADAKFEEFVHGIVSVDGPAVTRSLLAHFPIFFFGAALGWFEASAPSGEGARRGRMWWDAIVALAAVWILLILSTPLDDLLQIKGGRYNLPYIPLLIAVLLIGVPRSRIMLSIAESAPLRWLGVISYGFYLYHLPCISLVSKLAVRFGLATPWDTVTGPIALAIAAAAFAIALIVSAISFVYFERPLIRAFKRA